MGDKLSRVSRFHAEFVEFGLQRADFKKLVEFVAFGMCLNELNIFWSVGC